MSYDIRWEPRGVVKHFYGEVTDHDMMHSVIETESDPRFDELRYVINDFLDCAACAVANKTVDKIAVADCGAAFTNPHIRIAVVTTAPEIVSLTVRYAQSPLNRYPTRLFATIEDAQAWLNSGN